MTNNTNLFLDGSREPSRLKSEIFIADSLDVFKETGDENIPMKRMGKPEEFQEAFISTLSNDSSYIDMAISTLDGGKTVL
ncbi:MAG: hypothetical protein CMD08_03695 [Flavobacteriales bacterium]|nr:hypothetical protein [Flavobacteriales bacterium]